MAVQYANIKKAKKWFFEKIIKIGKPLIDWQLKKIRKRYKLLIWGIFKKDNTKDSINIKGK